MNVVRDKMTLGQSDATLSDFTGSPLFVVGVTVFGMLLIMRIGGTVSSVRRSYKRRQRRKTEIGSLRQRIRELEA